MSGLDSSADMKWPFHVSVRERESPGSYYQNNNLDAVCSGPHCFCVGSEFILNYPDKYCILCVQLLCRGVRTVEFITRSVGAVSEEELIDRLWL